MSNFKHSHAVILGATFGLGMGYYTYWNGRREKDNLSILDDKSDTGNQTEILQGSSGQIVRYGNVEIIQNRHGQTICKRNRCRQKGSTSLFRSALCGLFAGTSMLGVLKFFKNPEQGGDHLFWGIVNGMIALYIGTADTDDKCFPWLILL